MDTLRKLPIGVQNFERLRRDGCLYVDKTALREEGTVRGAGPRGVGKGVEGAARVPSGFERAEV